MTIPQSPCDHSRRTFLKTCAAGGAALLLPRTSARSAPATAPARPNIILISVDDMGYGDLGCYGGKAVPTPHIDSLARDGVRCTDGYVTAAVCAPSRCGLLTGAYQHRFGIQDNIDHLKHYQVPAEQKLLPEVMKAAGYATCHVGKWNMPRQAEKVFDEVHEEMDWQGEYWPGAGINQGIWGPTAPGQEYMTDLIGKRAVDFITRKAAAPFFLYLSFNAVHSPWQGKKEHQEKVAHLGPEVVQIYGSMCMSLDENVGRVLSALKDKGLDDNTVVAFISDNGPANAGPGIRGWPERWGKDPVLAGSAGPLRGQKKNLYDGGIRVPWIIRYPAKLKGGQVYSQPVSSLDFYPTFCAAAGVAAPQGTVLDGVDLLPCLSGASTAEPHERLFWGVNAGGAVRQGDWKLVGKTKGKEPMQLFNLREDIGETRDRAAEKKELAAQMLESWKAWYKPFPPTAGSLAKEKPGK